MPLQQRIVEEFDMPEVLASFETPVTGSNNVRYHAQACGEEMAGGGLWQGWLEFTPVGGGTPIRTSRETTQPNRTDAEYWATGLTPIFLEGALERALSPATVKVSTRAEPLFAGPAEPPVRMTEKPRAEAVLDPFSIYEKGEPLLRKELLALSEWHLVNIIARYELSMRAEAELERLPRADLVELIVAAVRSRQPVR
jgi:hypothetical protein